MKPPSRRGTKIRRRLLTSTVALAACGAGGVVIPLALVASATQAAQPQPASAVVLGRCPKHSLPLPPEAVARAADQARVQAPLLYRGSGPAVVVRSAQAPYAGPRGDEVNAQCGTRVFRRTVAVDQLFPKMLPSASLS